MSENVPNLDTADIDISGLDDSKSYSDMVAEYHQGLDNADTTQTREDNTQADTSTQADTTQEDSSTQAGPNKPDYIPDKFWDEELKDVYSTLPDEKKDKLKKVFETYTGLESEHTRTAQANKEQDAINQALLQRLGFQDNSQAIAHLAQQQQDQQLQQQLMAVMTELDAKVKSGAMSEGEAIRQYGRIEAYLEAQSQATQQQTQSARLNLENKAVLQQLVTEKADALKIPEIEQAVTHFVVEEIQNGNSLNQKTLAELVDFGYKIFNAGKGASQATQANKAATDRLSMTTQASASSGQTSSSKTFTRSQIAKMSERDFSRFEHEIDRQLREGLIVDDIS